MDKNKESWHETHFDIVRAIVENEETSPVIIKQLDEIGSGGLYDLANELTNKFESIHQNTIWGDELEYYNTMEEFIKYNLF